METLTYHPLPRRHRFGKNPETSHLHGRLTEPGLVSPLDRILKAQQQGLPVQFNAGVYLGEDFSLLDGLDPIELFEFRENLSNEIELRKKEFHAATKLLAERQKEAAEANISSDPDPDPPVPAKGSKKALKEADPSHNPS